MSESEQREWRFYLNDIPESLPLLYHLQKSSA